MSLMKMLILHITVWVLLHSRDVHGWLGPVTNSDLISGIEKFIKTQTHEIDILTIFPRKHNIFSQLFINSASKDLAFHFNLPLLVNHD